MRFAGLAISDELPLASPMVRSAVSWTPSLGSLQLKRLYCVPLSIILICNSALMFFWDRVVIFQDNNGGPVKLAERVHLYSDTCIQTGNDGGWRSVLIHIQPAVSSSVQGTNQIGCGVQIAPSCFYYDHGVAPGELIMKQPLQKRRHHYWWRCLVGFRCDCVDGVQLVRCRSGVQAVVTHDVPDGAIVVGVRPCCEHAQQQQSKGEVDPARAKCSPL